MAVHVCYNYLYISLPFCAGQQRIFALSRERELRQLIFKTFISNFVSGFGFAIVSTVINEANDFIVARDS